MSKPYCHIDVCANIFHAHEGELLFCVPGAEPIPVPPAPGECEITFEGFDSTSVDDVSIATVVFSAESGGTKQGEVVATGTNEPLEYSLDGETWQESPIFTELVKDQEYTFYVRDNFLIIDSAVITARIEVYEVFTNTGAGRLGDIQTFTIPVTSTYRITAIGAQGGDTPHSVGGKGALVQAEVELTEGDVMHVLVGQQGIGGNNSQSNHWGGGGGGGSFVSKGVNTDSANLLLAAGGGGGAYRYISNIHNGLDAVITENGGSGGGGVAGGTGGGPGGASNSGISSGALTDASSYGSKAFVNGGVGGLMRTSWGDFGLHGGFGGGGGAGLASGGGGGYSGGGSGTWSVPGHGGGGGSYATGANQVKTAGEGEGNGQVIIERL